jgi:hypothetical protein
MDRRSGVQFDRCFFAGFNRKPFKNLQDRKAGG